LVFRQMGRGAFLATALARIPIIPLAAVPTNVLTDIPFKPFCRDSLIIRYAIGRAFPYGAWFPGMILIEDC
jgi:hypothetical protein